jgi:hypothetical protein
MAGEASALVSGGRDEAIAEAENRFDVAGTMRIVPELPAEATEVTGERVVSDIGVGSPQRVRDLAIAEHGAGTRGEGVQEDVLVRRKPNLARPLTDALVQGVDLKIGNPKRSHSPTTQDSIAWQRNQHRPVGMNSHDDPVIPGFRGVSIRTPRRLL